MSSRKSPLPDSLTHELIASEFVSSGTGWPKGWVRSLSSQRKTSDQQSFVLGLVQGAYCLSPTGMLASMAEEVKHPETSIPRAMSVSDTPSLGM